MKIGDFIICTFQGDTASPPINYVAEITSIDPSANWLTCRWVDDDSLANFQYSANTSEPWPGDDGAGTDFVLETHDIYVPAAMSPGAQDIAVVTFADNRRYVCYVESMSTFMAVVFSHYPYYRLSFESETIKASDWEVYPAGSQILSIERCVLDNDIQPETVSAFNQGWWSLATRRDAHPGRIGGNINPFSVVVHTTDMTPETWGGLINRWTSQPGEGNCAHFVIGRDAGVGVIQLAPISRNANHAGGDDPGSFHNGNQSWHPNRCSVGIELHCAGGVRKIGGQWRLVEDGQPVGPAIPNEDVIPNPNSADRGWHVVTDYQYEQLDLLLNALETVLNALPSGCVATSVHPPPAWGVFSDGRIVGHVSLDAYSRSDPWPPTCDWLRAR